MKDFFVEKFIPGDNRSEDLQLRERIIMDARASLVLEGNVNSGKFSCLFDKSLDPSILTFPPANGDSYPFKFDHGNYHFAGRDFVFSAPSSNAMLQTALCMCFTSGFLATLENGDPVAVYQPGLDYLNALVDCDEMPRRAVLNVVRSAFGAVRPFSHCDTPEKICRYWGQDPMPYAAIKKMQGLHWNPWSPCRDIELRNVQPLLNIDAKNTEVFSFSGHWDETLRVLKMEYDGEKLLLPLTAWFRNKSNRPMFFFSPGEGPLPIFNREQVTALKDQVVFLTDSIEIAAQNQGQFDNAVWTSFYGDWRYTDWEPLKETQQVVMLVTNHSGRSLAEAYGTAKALADYLTETVGMESLGYIQLQTDYDAEPPKPMAESYLEMNMDEFRVMAERAEEALKPRPEFWSEPIKGTNAPAQAKDLLHIEQQPYRYLLRPFLVEGTTSLVHAPKGVGKSSFGYSIAGALTSIHKTELCPGTWWIAREKPCRVLYLDFENSEAVVSQRLKMFCSRYWGRGDEDNRAGLDNLVIRYGDQLPPCLNYALPENHAMVFRWLDEAEAQGHVDLMVIDTYSRFINSQESTKSVAGFTALCNQINQRGTTVLVIHHSGSDGDVRGFKEKRDILYSCVHLTREGGGSADDLYNAPLKVEWENLREPDYNPTQVIKLTPDGWMPDGIGDKEALEDFRRQNFAKIVEQYARLGFTDADMQDMLNISNGNFYALKKAVKE